MSTRERDWPIKASCKARPTTLQDIGAPLGSAAQIWADVAVKHSAALGDRSLGDEVEDTVVRRVADAVIVSGSSTGKPTALEDVRAVKRHAGPAAVYVGSGVDESTVEGLLKWRMARSSAQRSNAMLRFQRPSTQRGFARWSRLYGGSSLAKGWQLSKGVLLQACIAVMIRKTKIYR